MITHLCRGKFFIMVLVWALSLSTADLLSGVAQNTWYSTSTVYSTSIWYSTTTDMFDQPQQTGLWLQIEGSARIIANNKATFNFVVRNISNQRLFRVNLTVMFFSADGTDSTIGIANGLIGDLAPGETGRIVADVEYHVMGTITGGRVQQLGPRVSGSGIIGELTTTLTRRFTQTLVFTYTSQTAAPVIGYTTIVGPILIAAIVGVITIVGLAIILKKRQ